MKLFKVIRYAKWNIMKRLSQQKIMAVLMMGAIILTAGISDYKLLNYYVNDEMDYNEWIASMGNKIETDYISNLWLKYQYVNFNGFMCRLLRQPEMNDVVKLNNSYLTTIIEKIPDDSIAQYAEQTEAFSRRMQEKNIQYTFVVLPYVVDRYNAQMPTGIKDYGNENLDNIKQAMAERGIDTLDLRECLHNEGLKTYDIFFRTDHH